MTTTVCAGSSGGVCVQRVLPSEWPSPGVDNGSRPHVVICLCNRLAFVCRYLLVSKLSSQYEGPQQYKQIELYPSKDWT